MRRKYFLVALTPLLAAIILAPSLKQDTHAQDGPTATTTGQLNVRGGPGVQFAVLTTLPPQTVVTLEGRNAATDWVLVRNESARGWVAADFLSYPAGTNLVDLPVSTEILSAPPAPSDNPAPPLPVNVEGVIANAPLNVRAGPGIGFDRLNTIATGTALVLEGRTALGDWLLIHTADNAIRGWVAIGFVSIGSDVQVRDVPLSREVIGASSPLAGSNSSYTPATPAEAELIARLETADILVNTTSGAAIFARGQANGRRANVFTRTGDSITYTQPFLYGFGQDDYDLGDYADLQTTIEFFNRSPRRGVANSWVNRSQSTASGMNTLFALDPTWADPNFCLPDEHAVACEVRLVKPSVVIIMLGSLDVHYQTYETYTTNMTALVEYYIEAGVIPMLTTFRLAYAHSDFAKSLEFNTFLLDLSDEFDIPLINLWRGLGSLPDNGIQADLFHLTQSATPYDFTGDEQRFGITLRNLLTLQMLDELRKNVLMEG